MARGRKLVAQLETFPDEELACLGLTRGQIEAEIWLLERDWTSRHAETPETELEAIRRQIFGATA